MQVVQSLCVTTAGPSKVCPGANAARAKEQAAIDALHEQLAAYLGDDPARDFASFSSHAASLSRR